MLEPQKFRKKPVEIEAMQWPADDGDDSYAAVCQRAAVHRWVWGNGGKTWVVTPATDRQDVHVVVETLEGNMRISAGDWVIRGVQGEFYPCKPDIFAATYDSISEDAEKLALSDTEKLALIWAWMHPGLWSAVDGRRGALLRILSGEKVPPPECARN